MNSPLERVALTRQEAAALLGVDVRVISAAIHASENTLPAKMVGRQYRIAADQLRTWFDGLPDAETG